MLKEKYGIDQLGVNLATLRVGHSHVWKGLYESLGKVQKGASTTTKNMNNDVFFLDIF